MGKQKHLKKEGRGSRSSKSEDDIKDIIHKGEKHNILDVSFKSEGFSADNSDISRLTSSQSTENNSDNCTDEDLRKLAKQATKMAKKLKRSPSKKDRLSLQKQKEADDHVKTADVAAVKSEPSGGDSPKKRKNTAEVEIMSPKRKVSQNKETEFTSTVVSNGSAECVRDVKRIDTPQNIRASQTPKSRVRKIESNKQIRYETPEGYSLSGCCEGQLWAEDVEDSELWLVRMPVEFDVSQLEKCKPLPGSSIEVGRYTKDKAPYLVELQTVRNDEKQGSSYSVVLPSKETKTPECVGSFAGEIQVISRVVTKPYLTETQERKKRELPKGLKMRNIPFGAGVEMLPQPKLDDVPHSSQESDTVSERKADKKKRKKQKNAAMKTINSSSSVLNIGDNSLDDIDASQSSESRKLNKKKKHKHKEREQKQEQEVTLSGGSEAGTDDVSDFNLKSPSRKRKEVVSATGGTAVTEEEGGDEVGESARKAKKRKKHTKESKVK